MDHEYQEFLAILAIKYLKDLSTIVDPSTPNVHADLKVRLERLLSTARLNRAVSDRPHNLVLQKELAKELWLGDAEAVINRMSQTGILAVDYSAQSAYRLWSHGMLEGGYYKHLFRTR